MADRPPSHVDIVVGEGGLVSSVLNNVLALALGRGDIVATNEEFGKYDGRIIRLELVGPDEDPWASIKASLVPST